MIAPKRIQRKRTKGWRMPEGAIYVGRPSQWGNPISLPGVAAQFPSVDERGIAQMVVRDFAVLARRGQLHLPNWRFLNGERGPVSLFYPSIDLIRAELAGRDLACWCPLDFPCHGDVLLELANQPDEDGAQ